jgi:hypothetical protein
MAMFEKFPRTAKVACNLLVFNVICIVVFSIILPFLLAWNLVYAVYKSMADLAVPLVEENKRIYRIYYPKTNKKTQAHVLGEKLKETIRNN